MYFAIKGLLIVTTRELFTILNKKDMEQYTLDFRRAAAPFFGSALIITGFGFLAASFSYFVPALAFIHEGYQNIVVVLVAIAVAFLLMVAVVRKLVKK